MTSNEKVADANLAVGAHQEQQPQNSSNENHTNGDNDSISPRDNSDCLKAQSISKTDDQNSLSQLDHSALSPKETIELAACLSPDEQQTAAAVANSSPSLIPPEKSNSSVDAVEASGEGVGILEEQLQQTPTSPAAAVDSLETAILTIPETADHR